MINVILLWVKGRVVVAILGLLLVLMLVLVLWWVVRSQLVRKPKQPNHFGKDDKASAVAKDDLPIWPYQTMPLMTDSEVLFFYKLQKAMPEYLLFGQVQLSRIIEPNDTVGKDRNFWFNRVCRQSVDYVLVSQDAQTVLLAIELDDWTHQSVGRQQQDDKKDKALASAGIPIIRFHSEAMPTPEMIRHEILAVLSECGLLPHQLSHSTLIMSHQQKNPARHLNVADLDAAANGTQTLEQPPSYLDV